jgi:hypothetical protein
VSSEGTLSRLASFFLSCSQGVLKNGTPTPASVSFFETPPHISCFIPVVPAGYQCKNKTGEERKQVFYQVLGSFFEFLKSCRFQFLKYFRIKEAPASSSSFQNQRMAGSAGFRNLKQPAGFMKEPAKN